MLQKFKKEFLGGISESDLDTTVQLQVGTRQEPSKGHEMEALRQQLIDLLDEE